MSVADATRKFDPWPLTLVRCGRPASPSSRFRGPKWPRFHMAGRQCFPRPIEFLPYNNRMLDTTTKLRSQVPRSGWVRHFFSERDIWVAVCSGTVHPSGKAAKGNVIQSEQMGGRNSERQRSLTAEFEGPQNGGSGYRVLVICNDGAYFLRHRLSVVTLSLIHI